MVLHRPIETAALIRHWVCEAADAQLRTIVVRFLNGRVGSVSSHKVSMSSLGA
jgi:hypothetical protein